MKKRKVCLLVKRKENEKCEHRERKGIHPSDDDESERRELLRKPTKCIHLQTFSGIVRSATAGTKYLSADRFQMPLERSQAVSVEPVRTTEVRDFRRLWRRRRRIRRRRIVGSLRGNDSVCLRGGEAKRANRTLVVFQGERFGDDDVPVGVRIVGILVGRRRFVDVFFFFFFGELLFPRLSPLFGASLDSLS